MSKLKIIKPKPFLVFDHPENCQDDFGDCPELSIVGCEYYCNKFEFTQNYYQIEMAKKCPACAILCMDI